MKKMTPFPVLKFWNYLSFFLLSLAIFAQAKAGNLAENVLPKKLYIGGAISPALKKGCYSSINRERKVPVEEAEDVEHSDYALFYEKISYGYYIRLERKGRVIQTARALSEYELPLAAAALARDHIPED